MSKCAFITKGRIIRCAHFSIYPILIASDAIAVCFIKGTSKNKPQNIARVNDPDCTHENDVMCAWGCNTFLHAT